MNSNVASALISVLHSCGTCSNKAKSCQAEINSASDALGAARRDKWAKLDEFRQGLFCSGCRQTKSEILAKGERFPHDGQTIIPATPEQIAARERALDDEIDKINSRVDRANSALKAAEEEATEALDQLAYGVTLWRRAVGFEQRLVSQAAQDICQEAHAQFNNAGEQIRKIQTQLRADAPLQEIQRARSDALMWAQIRSSASARARAAMDARRKSSEAAIAASQRTRDGIAKSGHSVIENMTDLLRATLVRNQLEHISGSGFHMEPGAGETIMFRLGDVAPANRGKVLPTVRSFIERADATPAHFNAISAPTEPYGEAEALTRWFGERLPKADLPGA